MGEAAVQDQPTTAEERATWKLFFVAVGRMSRWLVFGVALAAVPVLISFVFLPKTSSIAALLDHGDFAVLASALVGSSIGELLGPDEPTKWLRNILISACIVLFAAAIVLLAGIAGNSAQLSTAQRVDYSWLLFVAAVVAGGASMGCTAHIVHMHGKSVLTSSRPSDSQHESVVNDEH